MTSEVIIGAMPNGERVSILPNMLNRHGLITGATGTGKTITLQVLTEQLSKMGVPVILSDVKGDLSGITEEGTTNDIIEQRTTLAKISDFKHQKFPSTLWDLHAKEGLPLRTTISEFGPVLLARILDLNDTQSDIIQLIFRYADDHGLLLLDMKDLDALLAEVVDKADDNYPVDALHVFAEDEPARLHNQTMLENINQTTLTIEAVDQVPSSVPNHIYDKILNMSLSQTKGLTFRLKVKIGARIMFTSNVDLSDNLNNGQIGTIVHIYYKNEKIEAIIMKFDDPKAGLKSRVS